MTTGQRNILIGRDAGYALTTVNENTFIGYRAGYTNDTALGVYLGNNAGYYETGASKLFIDNAGRTDEATARLNAMIYGEFHATRASQNLFLNANVTIREDFRFDGALSVNGTAGWSGTYLIANGDTVTVSNGIITNVAA